MVSHLDEDPVEESVNRFAKLTPIQDLHLQSIDLQVRVLSHLLHPPGAGSQRPHDPPRPRGHVAAVTFGGVAVTVMVYVLVLEDELGFPWTVTITVVVEVVKVTGTITTVPFHCISYVSKRFLETMYTCDGDNDLLHQRTLG
jgi:hypothetical protein